MRRDRPAAPISSSVEVLRRQLGLGDLSVQQQLVERWVEFVGEELAGVSSPGEIRGGELRVVVDSAAASEALSWASQRVVAAIGAEFGPHEVVTLRIRIRSGRDARKT